jgi:hypothetical protein
MFPPALLIEKRKTATGSSVTAEGEGADPTCVKVYRTAGEYKRGVEKMAREGWRIVAQSSATPGRLGGPHASSGFTKTLVTFERRV